MILRKEHENFSSLFLEAHQDIILQDMYHHIQAYLLHPPHCTCGDSCQCAEFRESIVLTLNLDFYNRMEASGCDAQILHAMRLLLQIPNDSSLTKKYTRAYPNWLIKEKLVKKEEKNHFKIVGRLVVTLIRLGMTYDMVLGESRASIKEAVDIILGDMPLKSKSSNQEKESYLGGEKAYGKFFNMYKFICHFIAARELMKKETDPIGVNNPESIKRFLKLSYWFRKRLLWLYIPNVKDNILFTEETLMPLPKWVTSDGVVVSIEPFEEIIHRLNLEIERQVG